MRSHIRRTNLIRIFGVIPECANQINLLWSLVTWLVNTQGHGTLVGMAALAWSEEVKCINLTLRNRLKLVVSFFKEAITVPFTVLQVSAVRLNLPFYCKSVLK